jgi:hypothetical protein
MFERGRSPTVQRPREWYLKVRNVNVLEWCSGYLLLQGASSKYIKGNVICSKFKTYLIVVSAFWVRNTVNVSYPANPIPSSFNKHHWFQLWCWCRGCSPPRGHGVQPIQTEGHAHVQKISNRTEVNKEPKINLKKRPVCQCLWKEIGMSLRMCDADAGCWRRKWDLLWLCRWEMMRTYSGTLIGYSNRQKKICKVAARIFCSHCYILYTADAGCTQRLIAQQCWTNERPFFSFLGWLALRWRQCRRQNFLQLFRIHRVSISLLISIPFRRSRSRDIFFF